MLQRLSAGHCQFPITELHLCLPRPPHDTSFDAFLSALSSAAALRPVSIEGSCNNIQFIQVLETLAAAGMPLHRLHVRSQSDVLPWVSRTAYPLDLEVFRATDVSALGAFGTRLESLKVSRCGRTFAQVHWRQLFASSTQLRTLKVDNTTAELLNEVEQNRSLQTLYHFPYKACLL
jgi:hypothetical protein